MLNHWLTSLRKAQGWTQRELANRLDLHRTTVTRWEVGVDPIPPAQVVRLAATLGVNSVEFAHTGKAQPIQFQPARQLYAAPYPCSGSLEQMLSLGPAAAQVYARAAVPAPVDQEIQQRFPHDSPLELLATYQFLTLAMTLEFRSCAQLSSKLLVTERDSYSGASDHVRHCLVHRSAEANVILFPQVSVALVKQGRRCRMDFLAFRGTGPSASGDIPCQFLWADIEVDGKFHAETADDDARRAYGLGLSELRYRTADVLRPDFPQRVLRDLARLPHHLGP